MQGKAAHKWEPIKDLPEDLNQFRDRELEIDSDKRSSSIRKA
jgi:hypothetical protein